MNHDIQNLYYVVEEMTDKLFGQKLQNKFVILTVVKQQINRLYKKNFNYDFLIQRSKKFNMQMTKFDYEIADLFHIKFTGQFSGVKFLTQLSNINLFQAVKEFSSSDEESNQQDTYCALKAKRQAIRAISYIPNQDEIFSHIAFLIDPETNLLVKYHQTMIEDVLFAVQQVDQTAQNIDQLFFYDNQLNIPDQFEDLTIQPSSTTLDQIKNIAKTTANIQISDQQIYQRHHFQTLIFHLTKCRQMLETKLQLWPFKFSYSFLFAEALDKNIFSCDDWELKKQEKMKKQSYLNWYMNTIANQMFKEFDVKFDDFEKFLNFINNLFNQIPSIQFETILNQTGQFKLNDIINKTKNNLIVRNQLYQEIDFYSLGQFVGYQNVIDFQQTIKDRFVGHIKKEYIAFPFTFLYKLAFKLNDLHFKLSDKFSTIKQKITQEVNKEIAKHKQIIRNNRTTIIQITELQSKVKKSSTVTAVVVYLHIFCQINFDTVRTEFTKINDFIQILSKCQGKEFQQKLLRNYNIQILLILQLSQEKFYHWQELVKPGNLKITRNALQNMFKGAQFASEQQNIQILIQLHFELESIGKTEICNIIASIFDLQVDQIQSPVFFMFEIFLCFIKQNLKLKYLFNSALVDQTSVTGLEKLQKTSQPKYLQYSLGFTKTKRDILMESLARSFQIK
ncbi:hypothetical protein SS50377_22240 [Spironucleus salmonicida]|uniref:Uncharacterized protein n=1 Tax=Spironucleus salmonicida TaxID=348837 RepID=V6LDF1_9EUKA|nr:hypothetical protein SS50377_22240 [Spironucleus salmonicida]|eukprot:EST42268.1 Hypothetical protein SS50377_18568 [Spironucleus salmonicida]